MSDYEQLKQFYLEKLVGVITAEDELLLQTMLYNSAKNREAWEKLEIEFGGKNTELFLDNINVDEDLEKVKRNISKSSNFGLKRLLVAASLLIVSGLAFFFYLTTPLEFENTKLAENEINQVQLISESGASIELTNQKKARAIKFGQLTLKTSENSIESIEDETASEIQTLIVPKKLNYQITLSDGTKVWLNSSSKLKFPTSFNANTREVFVEGEVYLEVAKNPEKPFIVHTVDYDIRVLGTKFNVNTYEPKLVKTALVEGSVSLVAKNGAEKKLNPGSEATLTSGQTFLIQPFDKDDVLAWRKGIYYFHHVPLVELIPVIERWFGMQMEIERKDLGNLRISGLLEKNQISTFLKDLKSSSGINSRIEENVIYIKK